MDKTIEAAISIKRKVEGACAELGFAKRYKDWTEEDHDAEQSMDILQHIRAIFKNESPWFESFFDASDDEEPHFTIFNNEKQIIFQGNQFGGEDGKQMFEQAVVSAFGNQVTQTNDVDVKVRDAREFVDFEISHSLQIALEQKAKLFWGPDIQVKPYKINLYEPNSHFAWHKDTPETHLIGTLLLGLLGGKDTHLKLQGGKNWQCHRDNLLGFFPDTLHCVKPIKADYYRMTLACKVFQKTALLPMEPLTDIEDKLLRMMSVWQKPFGLLLNYEYSITETSAWKGQDALLMKTAQRLQLKTSLIPVTVEFHQEEEDVTVKVYAIHPKDKLVEDMEFIQLEKGFEWVNQNDPGAQYTGNEARPSSEDSIYIHLALICQDAPNASASVDVSDASVDPPNASASFEASASTT